MANPLTQAPVLIFAAMMVSFMVTLAPIAIADLIRKP